MKLYVFGDTHYAEIVAELSASDPNLDFYGYTVTQDYLTQRSVGGHPVVPFESLAETADKKDIGIFCALGYRVMRARKAMFRLIQGHGFHLPNIIGSGALVADSARLGCNNVIMPGAVVEHDVQLGDNNVIWSNVTVCHNSNVGSHNFFAANCTIGGEVTVGELNFFGFSSVVEQARSVQNENLLGALSYLNQHATSAGKWLGVPATKVGTHAENGIQINDPQVL